MNDIDRTSAIGLARYARDYYDAAIAADDVLGVRPGYEIIAPAPVMFLIAHSIELILKSYLRHQGVSLSDIRKKGHELVKCWEYSVAKGLTEHIQLTDDDIDVLRLISDLHASTELRYIKTGYKQFPVFGPLSTLADDLIVIICPLVGFR